VSAIFVTGAGTDIGKTYVSCAILRALTQAGQTVLPLKPVVSGVAPVGDPAFDASDTVRLLQAASAEPTLQAIEASSPWRFAAPLSPDMAAALEGQSLAFADVAAWVGRRIAAASPDAFVLIEGVGGVMSPIAQDGLVLDLIAMLKAPALLVVGTYLGAISHTLTALAALASRDVPVVGVVVSETEGAAVTLDATVSALSTYAGAPMYALPRHAPAPAALVAALRSLHARRNTSATA
jgi:dethiobiotin synthetase